MSAETVNEWLLEQIAADKAAALKASNPPWTALTFYPNRSEVTNETEIDGGVIVRTPSKDDADVEHIARNDPAAVLRRCEAHRRIVERYLNAERAWEDYIGEGDGWPEAETLRRIADALRKDVIDLALVYADRPGYREEWAPA